MKLINNLNQTNSFDSSKKILPFTNTYEYVYDPSIFFKLNLLVYIYIYIERDIFLGIKALRLYFSFLMTIDSEIKRDKELGKEMIKKISFTYLKCRTTSLKVYSLNHEGRSGGDY